MTSGFNIGRYENFVSAIFVQAKLKEIPVADIAA